MNERRVTICVATYQRPAGLRKLLECLARIEFRGSVPRVQVIVVDNDAAGQAEKQIMGMADGYRWELKYIHEPRPGISAARNAALAAVDSTTTFVAFIDDDEYPDPVWLNELLAVQQAYQADIVMGPVLPRFESAVPDWVVRGGFFEWGRHATGTMLNYARTGNVLVSREILQKLPKLFDERFGLSGGEDHDLFLRLRRQGARIVWADDALVFETIPADRIRVSWLLRRAFRMFSSHTFCERELSPWYRVYPTRMLTGLGRMVLGSVGLIPSLFFPHHVQVWMMREIARGAGLICGLVGWLYREYGRPQPAEADVTQPFPIESTQG